MRHMVLAGLMVAALALPAVVSAQASNIGSVTLAKPVMADGKTLAPGTYQVRVASEMPPPVKGQSPDGARYVEFLKGNQVVAREVATVVSNADMAPIAKGHKVVPNGTSVELLKGGDYVRVWINKGGQNYLIHLPPAA